MSTPIDDLSYRARPKTGRRPQKRWPDARRLLLTLACLLWAVSAQAQVAYETSLAPITVTFDAAGETETHAFDAGSGSNRTVLVFVDWRDQDNTISGVTYNGVAMTAVAARLRSTDTLFSAQIWYLGNPASGSNNIAVTMGAGNSNSQGQISAWVANGTDAAGTPVDGYVTGTNTEVTANIASSPGAITSATGDRIVIFAANRNVTDNWTATATNYTERQDAANGSGISATFGDAAGAASVTPTATWNNSASAMTWIALGLNINASGGGGATCTGGVLLLGAGKCD